MKKKYLFLGLSLLFCGGSVFADDESVNKGVKEVGSFGELVSALQSSVQKAEAQTKIDDLQKDSIANKQQETLIQKYETISQDIDYVDPVYTIVNAYAEAVRVNDATCESTISYRVFADKKKFGTPTYYLYVTISDLTGKVEDNVVVSEASETIYSKWVTEWKTISASKAVNINNDADQEYEGYSLAGMLPSNVTLAYMKRQYDADRSGNYTEVYTSASVSVSENREYVFMDGIANALSSLLASQSSYMSFRTTVETKQETENYQKWVARRDQLAEALVAARKAYSEIAVYNNLKVVGDITVDGTDRSSLKVPAGCTIDGGFHYVKGVGTGTAALFAANEGYIENWISEEGNIAMVNTGFVSNCIVKNSAGKFAVYTDNVSTTFDDIVTAVYQNREVYGYDLVGKTVTASSENKLYQASYASAADKAEKSFYVNVNGTDITDGNGLGAYNRENAFIYIKDADAPEGITTMNVVANGVCENAQIVEGAPKAEFYIPTNFTAKNLNYARSLNSDVATVCLPFALTEELQNSINEKLGEGKQMYYYTCNSVDENTSTVWFGLKTAVDANTPCILAFTPGCKPGNIFDGLKNVDFVSTVGADLALIPSAGNDQAKRFRGNYKAGQSLAMLTEVAGGIGAYVYGFKDGRLVKLAENAIVNQFRSFVVYNKDLTQNSQTANGELRARFVDMDGNEMITTAIEKVSKDNAGDDFKVVGGNGAIEVSTSKACDVKIYTVGGSLVNTVRVEAGNTTLPLNAGLYIVNKNKVVVK